MRSNHNMLWSSGTRGDAIKGDRHFLTGMAPVDIVQLPAVDTTFALPTCRSATSEPGLYSAAITLSSFIGGTVRHLFPPNSNNIALALAFSRLARKVRY